MATTQTPSDPRQISQYVRDKANRTRLSIESYYAQTLVQCAERDNRAKKLEKQMQEEGKTIIKKNPC
jgi:hypothetical protein